MTMATARKPKTRSKAAAAAAASATTRSQPKQPSPPGQRREAVEAEVRRRRKRRGWTPFTGPQLDAFLADGQVDVIGFGGAGGGGKSDLALGLALLKHRRSVLYRRTAPQLAGLEERARSIYQRRGNKYNETRKFWRVRTRCDAAGRSAPPVRRMVQFSSMHRLEDREKARGIPFDLRVFDEAQNFLREQVTFAQAWTRTDTPGQHVTDLLTFNPPTSPEGLWLLDYFAPWIDPKHPDPAASGEVRWFVTLPDGKEIEVPGPRDWRAPDYKRPDPIVVTLENGETRTLIPRSRTFFRSLVTNNPVYMATGYMAVLDALPEPLRSQMRDGDFTAGLEDDAWQVIPTRWVQAAMERGRKMAQRPTMPDGKPVPLSGVGVDVAAGGKDQTAIARRYTRKRSSEKEKTLHWYPKVLAWPGRETPDGAAAAAKLLTAMGQEEAVANIDAIGVGQGLRTALTMHKVKFNAVNVAEASYRRVKKGQIPFANLKAEIYWRMREALDPENADEEIALPDDRELLQDLCAPRWSLTGSGIEIERKEQTIERTGRGLHKGEAVMLANYTAPVAGSAPNPWGKQQQAAAGRTRTA